jgi:hypothetical protein
MMPMPIGERRMAPVSGGVASMAMVSLVHHFFAYFIAQPPIFVLHALIDQLHHALPRGDGMAARRVPMGHPFGAIDLKSRRRR